MRTLLLCLAALLLPLVSAAADEAQVVRIGHAAPTSGWLARVGSESENGARLAVQTLNQRGLQMNGRPLRFELVAVDDAGEAQRARDGAHTLVAGGVVAVVGHLLSGSSLVAAPVYAAAGIAQVSPSATAAAFTRSGWPTAFRMLADDARIGAVLARHAVQELHVGRAAVVHDGSAGGQGLAHDFGHALREAGAEVVGSWQVGESVAELRTLVRELQGLAPDAVFFGGLDRQGGRLLQQMHRGRLHARFIGGDANCTPDLVSYWAVGDAQDEQVLCALPAGVQGLRSPALDDFVVAYRAAYRQPPEFYGAYAYDAVMVLVAALQRAGAATPDAVRQALAATREHPGVTGRIGFDARGDVLEPAVSLFTYRDEQRVLLTTLR